MPNEKKSIMQKLKNLFSFLIPKKEDEQDEDFNLVFENIKKNSKEFNAAKNAVALTKDALKVLKKRVELLKDLDEIIEKQTEINTFEDMSEDEINELKKIIARYENVNKEKVNVNTQAKSLDKSVNYLSRFETQVPDLIDEITDAEERQSLLKRDIGYLEGEKYQLEYDKEKIEFALKFNYYFSIFLVALIACAAVILAVLRIFYNVDVFYFTAVSAIAAITLGTVLFMFRRRMLYELELNEKMYNRAIGLLNKHRIHYSHYTNFLNYEYKKFKVKNSTMLKYNWGEYGFNQKIKLKQKRMQTIVYETERELDIFLRKQGVSGSGMTFDRIKKIIERLDNDNVKQLHEELDNKRVKVEFELEALDNRHQKIWQTLAALKEDEQSEEKPVEKIINQYLNEVESMYITIDK